MCDNKVIYGISMSSMYRPHENSESSPRRSSIQLYEEEASSHVKEVVVLAVAAEAADAASIIVDKPDCNDCMDLEYLLWS